MSEFDGVQEGVGEGGIGEGAPVIPEGEAGGGGEKYIPYQRFDQVYKQMQDFKSRAEAYKEFGDPKELAAMRAEHAAWKKAIEDHRAEAAKTPDEKTEAQRQANIRKEILKVYPELEGLNSLKELKAKIEQLEGMSTTRANEATLKDHSQKFSDTLKQSKIDLKHQSKIEEYIVSQMSNEEKAAFVRGDFEIAKRIFENELNEGLFAALKARPTFPTPARHNTPGGTPPKAPAKGPKTLKEAEDEAWERLSSGE